MLRRHTYRIYPNAQQKALIEQTFSACRLVYNLGLDVKKWVYQSFGKSISEYDLCKQLIGLKEDHAWLKEVYSHSLQGSIKSLETSYKNFFRGTGFPKYKSKRGEQSFQCFDGARKVDWNKGTLTIPKIAGIKIKLSRRFDGNIKRAYPF